MSFLDNLRNGLRDRVVDNITVEEAQQTVNLSQENIDAYNERLEQLDPSLRENVSALSENILRASLQQDGNAPQQQLSQEQQQEALQQLMSQETIDRLSVVASSPTLMQSVQSRLESAIDSNQTISGDNVSQVVSDAFGDLPVNEQLNMAEQMMEGQSELFDQLREEMPGNAQLEENTGQLMGIMADPVIQGGGAGGGSEALLNMAGDNPEQAVRILSSNGASGALERFEHSMTQHEEALAEYDEARQAYEQEVTEYEAAGGADSDLEAPVEPTVPEAPTLQDSVAQEAASHAMLVGGVGAIGTAGLIQNMGPQALSMMDGASAGMLANLQERAMGGLSQNGGRLEFGPFSVGPGVMMAMTNNSAYGMSAMPAVAGHFGMEFGGARGEVLAACDAANAEYYDEFVSNLGLDPSNISPDAYNADGSLRVETNENGEEFVHNPATGQMDRRVADLDQASQDAIAARQDPNNTNSAEQLLESVGVNPDIIPRGFV